MIVKPSHFPPSSLIKMPEWKAVAGLLCVQTFQRVALLSSSRPGHLSVLCLLIRVLCLLLVSRRWHWGTVVCKRQYITAPGFTQLPARPLELHSWEVSEFPRRRSMSNICSSLSNFRRPESCSVVRASEGGWGACEFSGPSPLPRPTRVPAVRSSSVTFL